MEPELNTINYYYQKIKNNDFTLSQLPQILNPEKSSLCNKARNEFDINFFERKIFSQYGEIVNGKYIGHPQSDKIMIEI